MDLLLYLSPYKGFESYITYTGWKVHLKPEDLVWIQLQDNLAVKSGARPLTYSEPQFPYQ